MNERTRRRLQLLAAAGLVACGGALVGLRLGRPLFYTDGEREVLGAALADAPMLVWERPIPELELPGPTRERAATLPDGRLLYARADGKGTSDLYVHDPRRPELPPAAAAILNSPGNELAPAIGGDGFVYFASDRDGGHGGFDLWRAPLRSGGFGRPECLGAAVNSALDESDPAPDPVGRDLVFVRRDPEPLAGANAMLMRALLAAALAPGPAAAALFAGSDAAATKAGDDAAAAPRVHPRPGVLHRDPAFSRDGRSLWFVEQRDGEPPRVLRTWRHGDALAPPVELEALRGFRAPQCLADGFTLRVQDAATPEVVALSRAHEVLPWWPGQHALEVLLFSLLVFCAVLLVLLALGRRWRQLDVVTWCLIASLLLHLLLLLIFGRMQLVHRFSPPPSEPGQIEVQLVSGGGGGETSQGEQGQRFELAAELAFAGAGLQLAAAAPGSGVEAPKEVSSAATPASAFAVPEPTTAGAHATAPLQDAIGAAAPRAGNDASASLDPKEAPTTAVAPAPAPAIDAKTTPPDAALAVHVPRGDATANGVALAAARSATAALPPSAPMGLPQASDAAAPPPREVALADPPSIAATSRGGVDAAESANSALAPAALPAPAAAAGGAVASDVAAPALPASTSAAAAPPAAAPSALARGGLSAAPATSRPLPASAPSSSTPLPAPRGVVAAAQPVLRDAPDRGEATAAAAGAHTARADTAAAPLVPLAPAPHAGSAAGGSVAAPRPGLTRAASSDEGAALPAPARPAAELARAGRENGAGSSGSRALPRLPLPSPGGAAASPRPFAPRVALQDAPLANGGTASSSGHDRTAPTGSPALVPLALAAARPGTASMATPQRPAAGRPGEGLVAAGIAVPRTRVEPAPRRSREMPVAAVTASRPQLYSNRFGPQKAEALERFGGTAETERAVQAGLAYLARVQQDDGGWGKRRRPDRKYGETFVGKTGLCLLAFLGAGHTQSSRTEYTPHVERALQFLLDSQDRDTGHFGMTSSYSHGITTYALAECYALTQDARLRQPVQRAVDWILAQQSTSRDRRNQGGFGYFSPQLRPEDRFSRASITAWMVMALESARQSGLRVPETAIAEARAFLLHCFDEEHGYFLYNFEPGRLRSTWRTLPASTPAAMFALLVTGTKPDDARIRIAMNYVLDRAPKEYRAVSDDEFVRQAAGNVYFWYYASLACLLAGGDAWDTWNTALKRVLPAAQSRDGSWEPIDAYARYAGDTNDDRAYTTAMVVLSLEVYYRYFTPLLRR